MDPIAVGGLVVGAIDTVAATLAQAFTASFQEVRWIVLAYRLATSTRSVNLES